MCWVAVAVVASVASAAVAAYSTYQSGQSAKKAGEFNAKVAENNELIQKRAAEEAGKKGATDAELLRTRMKKVIASQRAAFAGGGLLVDTGTAGDITAEAAMMGELDALTEINNAQRRAYGFEVQAMNYGAEAALQRYKGKAAKAGATLSAGGTVLGGMSETAKIWKTYQATPSTAPAATK